MNGAIFNIKRFAIHDGPGIRTTAFLQGCPLQCAWCHNPESIRPVRPCSIKRTGTDSLRTMNATELVDLLDRDRIFYEESDGGITISGGEPLMQPEFLRNVLQQARDRGLHTAVDTSGEAPFETFQYILPFTDLFLYDIKLMDDREHQRWTGVPNHRILKNLELTCTSGKPIWIRIPLIAGITDSDTNMNRIADHVTDLPGIERIHLLPYHAGGEHKRKSNDASPAARPLKAPGSDRLQELCQLLAQTGIPVFTGG